MSSELQAVLTRQHHVAVHLIEEQGGQVAGEGGGVVRILERHRIRGHGDHLSSENKLL